MRRPMFKCPLLKASLVFVLRMFSLIPPSASAARPQGLPRSPLSSRSPSPATQTVSGMHLLLGLPQHPSLPVTRLRSLSPPPVAGVSAAFVTGRPQGNLSLSEVEPPSPSVFVSSGRRAPGSSPAKPKVSNRFVERKRQHAGPAAVSLLPIDEQHAGQAGLHPPTRSIRAASPTTTTRRAGAGVNLHEDEDFDDCYGRDAFRPPRRAAYLQGVPSDHSAGSRQASSPVPLAAPHLSPTVREASPALPSRSPMPRQQDRSWEEISAASTPRSIPGTAMSRPRGHQPPRPNALSPFVYPSNTDPAYIRHAQAGFIVRQTSARASSKGSRTSELSLSSPAASSAAASRPSSTSGTLSARGSFFNWSPRASGMENTGRGSPVAFATLGPQPSFGYGDSVQWGSNDGIVVGKEPFAKDNNWHQLIRWEDNLFGGSHLDAVPLEQLKRAL